MVMVLVVLTFAAFIALDYFVLSKRPAEALSMAGAAMPLEPVLVAGQQVPDGVFLQPQFTWGRFGARGEVYLGVHPMLLGLVGAPSAVAFLEVGKRIVKGEPLARLERAGRRLTVRSPVTGVVEQVNRSAEGGTRWSGSEGNDGAWLYRIQPDRVAEEVPRWFLGEQAAEWTKRRYHELRAYLQDAVASGHLGTVMADGGELPQGILAEMDESVWTGLDDRFLARSD